MLISKSYKLILIIITFLSVGSITYKLLPLSKYIDDFHAENMYHLTQSYYLKNNSNGVFIETYLPVSNDRQRISNYNKQRENKFAENSSDLLPTKKYEGNNVKGIWKTEKNDSYLNIEYKYIFEGKSKTYTIPNTFKPYSNKYDSLLKSDKLIQSNNTEIHKLANSLTKECKNDKEKMHAIFDFVYKMPSAPIITKTDAISALKQNRASCNGKSRLLTALSRTLGYPARIKGGIIMQENQKRTSHAWVEVIIDDKAVPFDALNGHFGFLPANYLELYEGDKSLITRSPGIQFDYNYKIEEKNKIPFLKLSISQINDISPISLGKLIEHKVISVKGLLLLLMLPLGGLVVAFLRNVIGIKTFGVFLPVLIAFSLIETGFVKGILLFVFLILLVGAVTTPFDKLKLLSTPKFVISLTIMVLVMVLGSYLGVSTGASWLTSLTFFPTIILAMSAERFTNLIAEDGFQKATSILFQTLIAVCCCFFLLNNQWVSSILILFPEILMLVIVIAMLLGKYVGFRLTELFRFKKLITIKTRIYA
ncbi:7TM domain-containing protein [Polaribacter cellanae]|uniref:Transglutaminase-like domain-containing protein n=1 Tax=Polaribacter cellanae TaxID=2818493 RepID=A0A975H7P1_9FLAO|nr:7TM domain-containing protein [Polaribacter cellanae]QTE23263.1 hypothetical protein J3359_03025 [Polaribacter cellanae]